MTLSFDYVHLYSMIMFKTVTGQEVKDNKRTNITLKLHLHTGTE